MTSLHKASICLMLLLPLAVATSPGWGAATPSAAQTSPAAEYVAVPGVSSSVSTSAPVATSVRYSTGFRYGSADASVTESVLVVPARETDPETVSQMVNDLTIMGRIIEKNGLRPFLSPERAPMDPFIIFQRTRGMTGPDTLFSSTGRPKPLYIAGYGAAFFVQVDFPLLAPVQKASETETSSQEDLVWAETKRSLVELTTPGLALPNGATNVQPYNQDRVDGLRKSLISTMKHATNIRGLESQEWLTIVVQGVGSPTADPTRPTSADAALSLVKQVMTLRVKKADVDLFAKGQLDRNAFEQRLQVITY